MFSNSHFMFMGISLAISFIVLVILKKKKPLLKNVLSAACIGCIISEVIKIFSVIEIVPSTDGTAYYPYIKLEYLPFQLCSMQIFAIFYTRFTNNEKGKQKFLAFMYPTMVAGGVFAMLLPTVLVSSIDMNHIFSYPLSYQYFLYHAMLIIVGIYIVISDEVKFTKRSYLESVGLMILLGIITLYLNSLFGEPFYINGDLQSVEYTSNFLFTYGLPLVSFITKKWQWMLYVGIVILLLLTIMGLLYLPVIKKTKKKALTAKCTSCPDTTDNTTFAKSASENASKTNLNDH